MDSLKKIVFVLLAFVSFSAFANYPAGIREKSYCWQGTATPNSYKCDSPMFESAQDAAEYGCQQRGPSFFMTSLQGLPNPSNPIGLNAWGTYGWQGTCGSPGGVATSSLVSNSIQAQPDCGVGGTPIRSYAPATCAGSEPSPPPVSCSSTANIVISAYHVAPAQYIGCYAGCSYTAATTVITEYNGINYESGSWKGVGQTCEPTDVYLIGGVPGNSQNVGSGGGLVPSDLQNLATEQTLQQVLQTMQSGDLAAGTVAAENRAFLQQIAVSTAAIAAGGGDDSTTVPDPDGLEAEYLAKLAANQVDANGKLPDSVLGGTSVDVGATFSNVEGFIANKSCPLPPQFNVMGHTYSMDISMICSLGEALSYLVVVLASISGVKIFTGGM